MADILILPDAGKPWILGLQDGQPVRLSLSAPSNTARHYHTLRTHCGGMKDKPVDLKRMERTYAKEAKLNA